MQPPAQVPAHGLPDRIPRLWWVVGLGVIALVVFAAVVYASLDAPPAGFTGFRIRTSACWFAIFHDSAETYTTLDGCGSRDIPWSCWGELRGSVSKEWYEPLTLTLQAFVHGRLADADSIHERGYGSVTVRTAC